MADQARSTATSLLCLSSSVAGKCKPSKCLFRLRSRSTKIFFFFCNAMVESSKCVKLDHVVMLDSEFTRSTAVGVNAACPHEGGAPLIEDRRRENE